MERSPEYWFVFRDNQLLFIKDDTGIHLPGQSGLTLLQQHFIRKHPLGKINEIVCHCAEVSADQQFENMEAISLREAFEILGLDWYGALAKAAAIINWDRTHQFCGRCSAPTRHILASLERHCTACGLSFYPRISPSVIVLITRGNEILLSRSPHFRRGAYGLIAGFVEAGEDIEEAIHREVKEEVNLKITNLRYFGSQSWPFPDSLMIGFIADHAAGEIQIDQQEIIEAGWYRYDQLPAGRPHSISIASKLINYFVAQQTEAERKKQHGSL